MVFSLINMKAIISYEIGGGSLRSHQETVQEKIFTLLGMTQELS